MQESQAARTEGTKGPHDDFFCHKYRVWYRLDDCVFRGLNKTYQGCVSCFQGQLNIRNNQKRKGGILSGPSGESGPGHTAQVIQLRRI